MSDIKTWKLGDAADRAQEAKYTFYIPPRSTLAKLSKGNFVKLIFDCDVKNEMGWSAERMWVEILERDGDTFRGNLDNDPSYIPDLVAGDLIEFGINHIIQTDIEDKEPNIVDRYSTRCFVTSSVLYDGQSVDVLYREEPTAEDDNYSGWTFINGQETDEYLDNGDNWHYVSLGAVLNRCDRFVHLLDAPFDTQYTWNQTSQTYVKS
jgi:hypothetical protein